ncbi:hypothetical protein ABZ820_24855 [Streptomyces diacarni]|uniref:hypothetical protein n=1 Tax=Streptomyces diacarni TaxID=2800381 RepID=UPI0033EBE7EC
MRRKWGPAALVLAAGLLAGCEGSSGDEGSGKAETGASESGKSGPGESGNEEAGKSAGGEFGGDSGQESAGAQAPAGLDGTWRVGNRDSPLSTVKINGAKVETTGKQTCPGEIDDPKSGKPRITLHCAKPLDGREKGTVEVKPDGSKLNISWDGPEWGGYIDVFSRS